MYSKDAYKILAERGDQPTIRRIISFSRDAD
jgi:hypothetical protein